MALIHPGKSGPVPLHREANFTEMAQTDCADMCIFLGSYWPYSTSSYESRLVKAFKESTPSVEFQPQLSCLVDFYAREIVNRIPDIHFNNIVRALSSSETIVDKTRPQSLLIKKVCDLTKAVDSSEVFYRSQPRVPMRMVSNLSGAIALNQRLKYAAQDLMCRPLQLGEKVIVIDDIANTGATMRLIAWTLKHYFGVKEVWCINLAITRYGGGKDGKGHLELDTASIITKPGFSPVRVDEKEFYHRSESCISTSGKGTIAPLFFAQKRYKRCPYC